MSKRPSYFPDKSLLSVIPNSFLSERALKSYDISRKIR